MLTLLLLATLCLLTIIVAREFRPLTACRAAGQAAWVQDRLLSVNWNGGEEDKKSGGK